MHSFKKRCTVCLLILVLVLFSTLKITPSFAKFSDDYVTDNDAVSLQLHFDLGIHNIEEYEEIRVSSNSYEVFNVNVFNGTSDTLYYGIWYHLIGEGNDSSQVIVARLEDNLVATSGRLDFYEDKTASIIIKNNSVNDVVVRIGVSSSSNGVEDIEYLGGRRLVSGSASEVDYYYDDVHKKYVSSIDSNDYFVLRDFVYQNVDKEGIFDVSHKGFYKVEAWSAFVLDHVSHYGSGLLELDLSDKLYLNVGVKNSLDSSVSEVRVSPSSLESDSRIMYLGVDDEYFVSGHYGSISPRLINSDLEKLCVTGVEDILCSYHDSGKVFSHISIQEDETVLKPDGVMDSKNGLIRISPVVPLVVDNHYSVLVGEQFDMGQVMCVDQGSGCYVVKMVPEDTTSLEVGVQRISFLVTDDSGVVYRYTFPLNVLDRE